MSDHLDRDTGERMLRGEDTGPRPLAGLLAAASAPPRRHDRRGEEAAAAAFRAARAGLHVTVPVARRLLRPRALVLKATLAGLLLALAGGVALAASPHLASSSGHRHAHPSRTPATTSGSTHRGVPMPPHASPAPSPPPDGSPRHGHHGPGKHDDHGKHDGHGGHGHGSGLGGDGPGVEVSPPVQVPPLPQTPLPGQLPPPLPGDSPEGDAPSLPAGV